MFSNRVIIYKVFTLIYFITVEYRFRVLMYLESIDALQNISFYRPLYTHRKNTLALTQGWAGPRLFVFIVCDKEVM